MAAKNKVGLMGLLVMRGPVKISISPVLDWFWADSGANRIESGSQFQKVWTGSG